MSAGAAKRATAALALACAAVAAVFAAQAAALLGVDAQAHALPLSLLFAAAAALLFAASRVRDARLKRCAGAVGGFFALCLMIGLTLRRDGSFPAMTLPMWLGALAGFAALSATLGAATLWLYRGMLALCARADARLAARPEASRPRAGAMWRDGLIGFALTLACWIPVWLAFWPGTFRYDAATQFYTYMDGMLSTHHPLAHTLLMSWLMELGTGEADAYTNGVALYCAVQMTLTAGAVGYASAWMSGRRAPFWTRWLAVAMYALLPVYSLWSFSATKDVLFAALALVLALQWVDLLEKRIAPWRAAAFALSAALMMLMRNNGVYAFVLAASFTLLWAKGRRPRVAAALLAALALYAGANAALIAATEAEGGSAVELLSVPLQQVARVAYKGECSPEEEAALSEFFQGDPAQLYWAQNADSVKWNVDEDALLGDPARYLKLWLEMGLRHPQAYLEAFFVQDLPYYMPGSPMIYNIVLGVEPMELYPVEPAPLLPALAEPYRAYDRTLTIGSIPATRALGDCAVMAWLCAFLAGFALYTRRRGLLCALAFLAAIWFTCLLGPVAVMRYVLSLFLCAPALAACAVAPGRAVPPRPCGSLKEDTP